jgi:hypothetical protein
MSRIASIAILDGGTYYHYFAINTPAYRPYFDQVIYALELASTALDAFDALIVIDRLHPHVLRRNAAQLLDFANQGKTLVVFGEVEAHTWLPGARWMYRPTNFWWWLEPGADLGLRNGMPEHCLFRYLPLQDAIWHYHGLFQPPPGADRLIVLQEEAATVKYGDPGPYDTILYEDRVSTAGRLLVTCLDPFFHHGSNFMPATTRFITGFLQWLRADLSGHEA